MRLSVRSFVKAMSQTKSFLFWFSNEEINFRFAELEALVKVFQLDPSYIQKRQVCGPFVVLNLPSEDYAKKIMSRTVLIHSCTELWGSGNSMDEVHEEFKTKLELTKPYENSSFRVNVDTYGRTIPLRQKIDHIETFEYLPMNGNIDLKNPEVTLQLTLFYGMDSNNVPENPLQVYFGRWVADGQRNLAAKISLKTRKFIGNTSMDPLLSLLMANLALVKPNDLVLDPFVGTGSLLIAAAMMGGYVLGTDIDFLMLHARTRPTRAKQKARANDESVRANFIQYGVESQYLDVMVADASIPALRKDLIFDSIITDPPYGLREPTEKIGTTKVDHKIKEEHLLQHFPSKLNYPICEIFSDLINFSAERLTIGGRVVFWLPVSKEDYEEQHLPQNPCFELVANCEQTLSSSASRRLLVYEKIHEPLGQCFTTMDSSSNMYRFRSLEPNSNKPPKDKKPLNISAYRKSKAKKREGVIPVESISMN